MANYELKKIKPVLVQQAVQYEKEKFAEYLKENPGWYSRTRFFYEEKYKLDNFQYYAPF